MVPQVLPEAYAAHVHHHEGGNSEDRSGDQGFTYGGRGAGQILLEHAAAEEGQPEQGDGNHRGGDRGRHGLAGLHAQIRVGRAEHRGKQNAGHHRLGGKLGLGRVVRNEGLEFRHGQKASSKSKVENNSSLPAFPFRLLISKPASGFGRPPLLDR